MSIDGARVLSGNRALSDVQREAVESKFPTRVVVLIILIGLYYLSYRYPLQVNSSGTSPTYSDTPTVLQVGKYLVLAPILALTVLHVSGRTRVGPHLARAMPIYASAIAALSLWALGKGILVHDVETIGAGFMLLIPVALLTLRQHLTWDPEKLSGVLTFFAVASIVVDACQYALFRTAGRLPALAYKDSAAVRFGSILDDPNGYACLVTLLAPVVWYRFRDKPVHRWLILAGLTWTLILTQSFTGVATVIGVLAVITLMANRDRPTHVGVLIVGGAAALVAGTNWLLSSQVFARTLQTKLGSIESHQDSLLQINDLDLVHLLGISSVSMQSESGWILSLLSLGAPWTIGLLMVGVLSFWRLIAMFRTAPTDRAKGVHLGFAAFQLVFLVASFNSPPIVVFPLNTFFALGLALAVLVTRPSVPELALENKPVLRRA